MSPPTKIRKTDDTSIEGGSICTRPEGIILFDVNKVSTLNFIGKYSGDIKVGGVHWRGNVCKQLDDDNEEEMLALYLCCMIEQSVKWNVDVDAVLTLFHPCSGDKRTVKETYSFKPDEYEMGEHILKWGEMKEFINDDKITVEIRFSIFDMNGIRNVPFVDFTDANDPRHDVTLMIKEKKIYASKQFLSLHSSVFKSMFYDDSDTKDKNEVKINEIDYEKFLEMLHVIYPFSKRVTDENVMFLLKLGYRFQIKLLLDLTEKHLIESKVPEIASKLLLSDQYGLSKLQDYCTDQISQMEAKNGVKSDSDSDADDVSSGFIRFKIKNVSEITDNTVCSPVIEVQGTPWNLWALKKHGYPPTLGVYLNHRHSYSNIWSINVSAVFTLVNKGGKGNHIKKKLTEQFCHKFSNRGFSNIISWDDLIDEEKGFIVDGGIIIEARITLSKFVGIRVHPPISFTDSNDPRQDATLVIDGKKIHVSKQILAFHSPFFNAMFYGNFAESNKKEIELKDVNRKEFIEMLNVIYPSCAKATGSLFNCLHNIRVTDASVEYLLKLGDRFQIKMVIDQAEQFLINSTNLTIPEKLKLSDQFRLVYLQDHCLESFKTPQDIKNIEDTESYKALSNDAKSALMDRIMKLLK